MWIALLSSAWAVDVPVVEAPVVVGGTLSVDPGRSISEATTLFVSVRDPAGGPPLAALKLAPGPFPLKFVVTEANAILMGGVARPFPAKVDLTIRLDKDGDPLTKDDGLPQAILPGTTKGNAAMKITLK
jgi:hypothetical protein